MSDTLTTWPDAKRPGVPLNPGQDGWHWLIDWNDKLHVRYWFVGGVPWYGNVVRYRYLGPVLTPAEVAAAVAEARRAALEEAAQQIECGCDPARRAAVVAAPPNSAARWNACGAAYCCAIGAAAIRALAKEPGDA